VGNCHNGRLTEKKGKREEKGWKRGTCNGRESRSGKVSLKGGDGGGEGGTGKKVRLRGIMISLVVRKSLGIVKFGGESNLRGGTGKNKRGGGNKRICHSRGVNMDRKPPFYEIFTSEGEVRRNVLRKQGVGNARDDF